MPLERITVSQRAKDQLTTLKRRTGIEHWNVLCRWALCTSLAADTRPPNTKEAADSNLEMSWATFAGDFGDLYWAAVKQRCLQDGLDPSDEQTVEGQFKVHLHRGISYLSSNTKIQSIFDLIEIPIAANEGETKKTSKRRAKA